MNLNKRSLLATLTAFIFITTTLNSCKPEEHDHGQETITTLKVKLTPVNGGAEEIFTYKNLNSSVTKDVIKLTEGTSYYGTLEVLDETQTPSENITSEIAAEKDEHQFFYTASSSTLVFVGDFDKDSNGKDVGLQSVWTGLSKGTGTVKISLKHLGEDPKTGNINDGETDLEVVFDVEVQ